MGMQGRDRRSLIKSLIKRWDCRLVGLNHWVLVLVLVQMQVQGTLALKEEDPTTNGGLENTLKVS